MRQIMRCCAVALLAAVVSACTGTAHVRPVSVDTGQGFPKIPGTYAAHVQTGGWHLEADPGTYMCSMWSFDTDVNGPYTAAMRDALTGNLETVRFVGAPLQAADLQGQGIDAQIVVYQGNANSQFGIQSHFFTSSANGTVSLEAIIAILTADGLSFQKTVQGVGHASDGVFLCDDAADAVGEAARAAIRETVEDAILYIREGVRSTRVSPRSDEAAPTS